MEMNHQLFEQLSALREELKKEAAKKNMHFYIPDSVLEQISLYKPLKPSDFEGISGTGPAFIENYANRFIEVVKAFVEEPANAVELNKKGISVLQDFEKKLVNLNKRNHLLYCSKLYNKYGVDLEKSPNDIRNIVLGAGRAANVVKNNDANYKAIVSLLRNNTRTLREKGQNNLFVAYPFVKGKFAGDDFAVRAPLALFPVKGERSASGIKLSLDKDREVLYNSTLILANFKFNKIKKPMPDVTIEDTGRDTFIDSLLKFYEENKISIKMPEFPDEAKDKALAKTDNDNVDNLEAENSTDKKPEVNPFTLMPIEPFENFSADTFPKFKKGEFYLENSAVLGLFSIASSSIQKDFQQIVQSKSINKLLDDLLGNKDYVPFDSTVQDVSEKDIVYINKLDAAQENVIAALSQNDELVVQGPPGTGKSQTITSLIADFATKNKSILLVSEKKTALDVVYSRLGNLSKYSMLLDDCNDKLSFYDQLSVMAQLENVAPINEEELTTCEQEIDELFGKLKGIDEAFYKPDDFGLEPYKLYLLCNLQQILAKENLKKLRQYKSALSPLLENSQNPCSFTYNESVEANQFYKDEKNLSKVKKYLELFKEYSWLENARRNLTDFELQEANIDFDKINEDRENRNNQKFFKKVFSKNMVRKDLNDFCQKYFDFTKDGEKKKIDKKLAKKLLKNFYKNQENLEKGFDLYNEYWKLKDFYSELSDETKKYFDALELLYPLQKISEDTVSSDKEKKDKIKIAEQTEAEEELKNKAATDENSADEVTEKELPENNLPENESSENESSNTKIAEDNLSEDEVTEKELPEDDLSENETPENELTEDESSEEEAQKDESTEDEAQESQEDDFDEEKLVELSPEEMQKWQQANDEFMNYLLANHLIDVEAKYRQQIPDLDNFDTVLKKIDAKMAKKRLLEKQRLENCLAENISILSKSKRRSEILKQIEAKRKWSVNKFINKFNFELFNAVKIWLLTPEVVSEIIPLEAGFFDLVVFDEASQMFVEKGLPSILRGKKVVIAGDQNQLRPSNLFTGRFETDENAFDQDAVDEDEEIAVASDEESLLDLARFKYNKVMLNFHYRSKFEELIAFSNYAFYEGKLNVSPNRIKPELPPIQVHKMEDALWTKRANEAEAAKIVELIKTFFKERQNNETIGVITFNTNQRDKIDDFLDKECENDPEFAKIYNAELVRKEAGQDIGLFVKNIETVQGDERDVIIFSMGYAKNEVGKFIQNFGWLNQSGGENRLNVAISRAKQKIHIVVSFEPSELKTDGAKNNGPATLKKYLEYAFAVSDCDVEKEKQILNSFINNQTESKLPQPQKEEETSTEITYQEEFEKELEAFLRENGYDFDKNVGIGGYTIDFAVKNDGQYVLGLECDGNLYAGSSSTRERDYYRQKYLEARGWKLYRVWSILWKKNQKAAAKKLLKAIEESCKASA
ncbi:MAG: AAA domain-containing protein [Treponema sp.]|nr:AAA domain-containing protein [Treponema sp.]